MKYVVSDIHGCYGQFLALLREINFRDSDTLFVLGDCVDRGPRPMELLLDLMCRPNVFPILGNHDLLALVLLRRLCADVTEENIPEVLSPDTMAMLSDWLADGGETTYRGARRLSPEQRLAVVDYLEEFAAYEEVAAGGREYVLVHGGLEPFRPGAPLSSYSLDSLLFSRPDYGKPYFPDKFTVTGHTPTLSEPGNRGSIIRRNNHIAIDCGCVFGGNLAAFCLDTGEEFYVPGVKSR